PIPRIPSPHDTGVRTRAASGAWPLSSCCRPRAYLPVLEADLVNFNDEYISGNPKGVHGLTANGVRWGFDAREMPYASGSRSASAPRRRMRRRIVQSTTIIYLRQAPRRG